VENLGVSNRNSLYESKGSSNEAYHLLDLTFTELQTFLKDRGQPKFRAEQIYRWIYQKSAKSFESMSDLGKKFRLECAQSLRLDRPEIHTIKRSWDGTVKFLIRFFDGKTAECVLIPAVNEEKRLRLTLCVSSQVGCAVGCRFCNTALQGLERNLHAHEIISQILIANDFVEEEVKRAKIRIESRPNEASIQVDPTEIAPWAQWAANENKEIAVRNIVYMGMGEPFHNYNQVMQSVRILVDEAGLDFSKRKITISTSGILPGIEKFAREEDPRVHVNLALSLNGADDEIREETMPINKAYPLKKIFKALRSLPLEPRRRITFEYILMKGVNDDLDEVPKLVKLLRGLPSKMNLIPYNEFPGSPFKRPPDEQMLAFQKALLDRGVQSNLRVSRGQDIFAACGMLNSSKLPH
jgi:23S rRNA (adenine2503-C2)-methyltransferase